MKNVDILVAGPSVAFRSFDPAIFKRENLNIFIMGSSAQTPLQTEYLVGKYLDKIKPKIFIYVANMKTLANDGVEGWLFLINNIRTYDGRFLQKSVSSHNYYVYNALCYNMITNKFSNPKPFKSEFEHYVSNGFVQYYTACHDSSFYTATYPENRCDIPTEQKEAFTKMLKLLKERNIPVLVVQPPEFSELFKSTQNPGATDSFFTSFQDVRYVNFNYIDFNKYYFWDAIHMNQDGVVKFDNMVIDSMKKWKYLPLHN